MMKIISGVRRAGKTYEAIQESARTGFPIVVPFSVDMREIKQMALEMGLVIPSPIVWDEFIHRNGIHGEGEVIIDDADWFLRLIVGRPIWAITISEPVEHIKLEIKVRK